MTNNIGVPRTETGTRCHRRQLIIWIFPSKDTSIDGEVKPFYEDEENEDESDEEVKAKQQEAKNKPQMDPDHALLLKNSRPLLQSRNASVSW